MGETMEFNKPDDPKTDLRLRVNGRIKITPIPMNMGRKLTHGVVQWEAIWQ